LNANTDTDDSIDPVESSASATPKKVDGPRLYSLAEGEADALVLHCSDPRFQPAFRAFLSEQLNITHPALVIGPGSISAWGVQMVKPKMWHAMRQNIELMAARHPIKRLVIITHDDCKSYAKLASLLGGLPKVPGLQRDHLKKAADFIVKEYLPNATVELYHAAIVTESNMRQIRFDKVI